MNIIPDGTYYINLTIRDVADERNDSSERFGQLNPNFGIQQIPDGIFNGPYETTYEPSWEWGSIRARLNYPGENNPRLPEAFKGNYLHGKKRPGDYTASCVCERSEIILNILLKQDPQKVPKVPVWVRTFP